MKRKIYRIDKKYFHTVRSESKVTHLDEVVRLLVELGDLGGGGVRQCVRGHEVGLLRVQRDGLHTDG